MKAIFWLYLEVELNDLQHDFESIFDCTLEIDSEDYWEWLCTKDNKINRLLP